MNNGIFGRVARAVAVLAVVLVLGVGGLTPAAAQGNGTIVVTMLDEFGNPQPNGCVTIHFDNGSSISNPIDGRCDGRDDGTPDGRLTFVTGAGNFYVLQGFAPQGYVSGSGQRVSVSAGETENVEFRSVRGGRDLFLLHRDALGNPLRQACFTIYTNAGGGQRGVPVSSTCDGPQGDPGDGVHYFAGFASGSYVAVETEPAVGQSPTSDTVFSVGSGAEDVYVTVVNEGQGDLIAQLIAVLIAILQQILGG